MAIQASKPNNKVFLLLGIVLAALAFGGVLFALRQSNGAAGATVGIVVTSKPVAAGTTLTGDMVNTSQVPTSAVPADAYTAASSVVGKTATVAIAQNTPLVPAFFGTAPITSATTTSTGNGGASPSVETQITKGYVALAIPAAPTAPPDGSTGWQANTIGLSGDLASAGYYIQQGDHIDILIDPGNSAVRYSFQDLPVLRVGTSGASSATPTVYVVEVPRSQAELLTELVTLRGIVKDTPNSIKPGPYVVKYVLRPVSEWGKMAPDGSSYTPNYESTSGPSVPSTSDNESTVNGINALFGH